MTGHPGVRVWLLRTPSHARLLLGEEQSPGPAAAAGNYSVSDITEAVAEFITLNHDWVRDQLP